jgi:hypothetical protein
MINGGTNDGALKRFCLVNHSAPLFLGVLLLAGCAPQIAVVKETVPTRFQATS